MKQLQQAKWASWNEPLNQLNPIAKAFPIQMQNSDGSALPLLLDPSGKNPFGADLIRFEAGKGVALHRHEGSHILIIIEGQGELTYFTDPHPMFPGMIYLIPSQVPHAIKATRELVLIAVGNDHRPANSAKRLELINPKQT